MTELCATIPGRCPGKGSKRAVITGGKHRPARAIVIDDNPSAVADWRGDALRIMEPLAPPAPLDGPVMISVGLYHARPLTHYVGGKREKGLRNGAPTWASKARPDADKALRAVWDACTRAGWILDDARVCEAYVTKQYCDDGRARTVVVVRELEEPCATN